MKLSPNFYLQEFKGLDSPLHIANFRTICFFGLEPIRAKFGGPVMITSGYRSEEYNKMIGGSPTSQHIYAEAVDFIIPNVSMKKVFEFAWKELAWPGQVFFYAKKGHMHLGLPRMDLAPTKKIMEVGK